MYRLGCGAALAPRARSRDCESLSHSIDARAAAAVAESFGNGDSNDLDELDADDADERAEFEDFLKREAIMALLEGMEDSTGPGAEMAPVCRRKSRDTFNRTAL